MILFRTCWHRNFILLVLVCMCWNGSVARQKAREHEQNEPSTQSTPRVSANATTATTTTPKEQGLELEQPHKTSGILNLGCQGIRIRRYVSNGFCTSRRPIRDMLCDGQCLPMDELPWFPEFSKIISRHKREWRCVPDDVRSRKVTVFCNDGTKHKYRVRVVRSCKCKRYTHKQNQTNP
ncbi:Sclerostin domain-containing protein 1 [Desmophyllum pertusum]|uniref:Sclerostin domain-containing protein 1 n=1 Tax=Desmophyllum pertusum TaxID=174260 RepID=A0A9W9ZGG3_9CNID|nr:Sclerostin domain-containing protein 1 [Desmophyllum pertusum]